MSRKGTDPVQLTGVAMFDVHGDLPCSICMPLVPKHTDGEVRIVLTWGQFPDDIILKVIQHIMGYICSYVNVHLTWTTTGENARRGYPDTGPTAGSRF
jgi:hypothetical protein